MELRDARIEVGGGVGGVRLSVDAGGDDNRLGLEATVGGARDVAAVFVLQRDDCGLRANRHAEPACVRLEVVRHLVARWIRRPRSWKLHARETVAARGGVEPE